MSTPDTGFALDHMALGVADLDEGVRRLTAETGLGCYPGGRFPGSGLANTIVPLGGDVYLEVEGVVGEPVGGAAWFARATRDGRDRWMFWCLRAESLADLEGVAARLGGTVTTAPGRVEPDGTRRTIVSAPGGAVATAARRRGLPNWYYREDPGNNPARRAVTGARAAAGVAWLEVAADEADLRAHVGAATFDRLPLRLVDGEPGLHAVAVHTADGAEVVIRRPPAGLDSYDEPS